MQLPFCQSWSFRVLSLLCLSMLFCSGCDLFLAFTDVGLIKSKINAHTKALSESRWKDAASYYHGQIQWQSGGGVRKGKAAASGFLASIRDVSGRNDFFSDVLKIKQVNDAKIVAAVRFKVHIIKSGMAMEFRCLQWRSVLTWVKAKDNTWKIISIKEISPRTKARFSQADA